MAENIDENDSNMKWLLPLIILILLVLTGFWFCSKTETSPASPPNTAGANTNVNANK